MKHDKRIHDAIDISLSGLAVSPERQQALIDSITGGKSNMKHKIPFGFVLAAVIALIGMTALAAGLNLFDYFSDRDARYGKLSSEAGKVTAVPAEVESQELGKVNARIDSAYYDGRTLLVGIIIENASRIEPYTPAPEELTPDRYLPDPIFAAAANEEQARIYAAYSDAVDSGAPYGYALTQIYLGDHAHSGEYELLPYESIDDASEPGVFRTIRQYELPPELMDLESLPFSITLKESRGVMYFDGAESYYYGELKEAGSLTAVIQRTNAPSVMYAGSGKINDVTFTGSVQLSAMEGTVTVTADQPDFFRDLESEYGPYMPWHLRAFDENGTEYAIDSFVPSAGGAITAHITGSGELPNELHMYFLYAGEQIDVYSFWPDAEKKLENPFVTLTR